MLTDEERIADLLPVLLERRAAFLEATLNRKTHDAIESAATAPLLARIAELEAAAHTEISRLRAENAALNEKLAQVEQDAQPVTVYQYQLADGSWIDQTKDSHDYNVLHGKATVRTLYTSPPKQVPMTLWNGAQHKRAYDNSPELHKDVPTFASFKRVALAVAEMYGIGTFAKISE